MDAMASQITSLTIVYSTVCSSADQRKHQSSASLAFVRGIHRWPVNSPHKWPVKRKMLPFDDVIMKFVFPNVEILIRKVRRSGHCSRNFILGIFVCIFISKQPQRFYFPTEYTRLSTRRICNFTKGLIHEDVCLATRDISLIISVTKRFTKEPLLSV